jgi:hypothetical protein
VDNCVKGIEVTARPFCLASRGAIVLARAHDNLLFELNKVAATGFFH